MVLGSKLNNVRLFIYLRVVFQKLRANVEAWAYLLGRSF